MAKNCKKKSKSKEQLKNDFKLLQEENKNLKQNLDFVQKQNKGLVKQNRQLQKELSLYKPTFKIPINLLKPIGAPITYLMEVAK